MQDYLKFINHQIRNIYLATGFDGVEWENH